MLTVHSRAYGTRKEFCWSISKFS